MSDRILSPSHYTTGEIEVWDAIVALGCGYLDGNVIKYMTRFRHKGDPIGDLQKAKAYIDKLIEVIESSIDEQTKEEQRRTAVEELIGPSTNSVYWPYDVQTSSGTSHLKNRKAIDKGGT